MSFDKTERVVHHINSFYRTTGVSENFTLTLDKPIFRVSKVDVVSIEIPYSFYVVNVNNNVFDFEDGIGTPYQITIPVGNYDGTTFATQLTTSMDAVYAGWTINYNNSVYKLEFEHTGDFKLLSIEESSTSTASPLIGVLFNGVKEITKITTVAQANIIDDEYIDIGADGDNILYRIWFNQSGIATGPAAGGRILVEVDISSDITDDDVAISLYTVFLTLPEFFSTYINNIVTVTDIIGSTITNATHTVIDGGFDVSTPRQGSGAPHPVVSGSTFQADGMCNLSGPGSIFIRSNTLTRPMRHRPVMNNGLEPASAESKDTNNILTKMPLMTGPGTQLIGQNVENDKKVFAIRQTFKTLDFQLTDVHANQLDLNGLPWSITLAYEIL